MSTPPVQPTAPAHNDGATQTTVVPTQQMTADYLPTEALEKLKPETRELLMVFGAFFRSTTGPDPETARIAAESEMHSESCKLDGYKETLKNRDAQNARDHLHRSRKLTFEMVRDTIFQLLCVVGMGIGLYLLVVKGKDTLGSDILLGAFIALLGGGKFLSKDKD